MFAFGLGFRSKSLWSLLVGIVTKTLKLLCYALAWEHIHHLWGVSQSAPNECCNHYTPVRLQLLKVALPTDVRACLTSPAWVHVRLLPQQTRALYSKPSAGRTLPLSLDSNCGNLYTTQHTCCSLWCHCLSYKSQKAETSYAVSF